MIENFYVKAKILKEILSPRKRSIENFHIEAKIENFYVKAKMLPKILSPKKAIDRELLRKSEDVEKILSPRKPSIENFHVEAKIENFYVKAKILKKF